jgi:hypothetical protein
MNRYELEQFALTFEVWHHNKWLAHELIGKHVVGLSTLYREEWHRFYRVWLRLEDPDSPNDLQGWI